MRLQLDSAQTGTGITRAGETGHTASVGGTAADSSRIKAGSSSADSIQISGPSSALNRLATDRAARIEQLTALVQSGSYEVSGSKLGSAIVADAVSGVR